MNALYHTGGSTERALSQKRVAQVTMIIFGVILIGISGLSVVRHFWVEAILELIFGLLFIGIVIALARTNYEKIIYRLVGAISIFISGISFGFEQYTIESIYLGAVIYPLGFFYLFGLREGSVWSFASLTPYIFASIPPNVFSDRTPSPEFLLQFFTCWGILMMFAAATEWYRNRSWQLYFDTDYRLRVATDELETLGGLVPICSYCKSIRDDDGYWRNLESYLAKNTAARVSSGLCSACSRKANDIFHDDEVPIQDKITETTDVVEAVEKIKLKTLTGIIVIGVVFISGFSFREFFLADMMEGTFQAGLAVIMGIGGVLLQKNNRSKLILNFLVGVLVIVLIEPFFGTHPNQADLLWFFVMPVLVDNVVGYRQSIIWSGVLSLFLIAVFFEASFLTPFDMNFDYKLFLGIFFGLLVVESRFMERLRVHFVDEVLERIEKLETTYKNIKTLKGLVPICAACKSIRDDHGFWISLENYISDHTEIRFTHGICQDCLRSRYPSLYDEMVAAGEIVPNGSSKHPRISYQSSLLPMSPSRTK